MKTDWIRSTDILAGSTSIFKRTLRLVLAGLLSTCVAGHCQVLTGEIDGTVRDTTGAVIPDALVTITNSDQNLVSRSVKTDSNGQFTAPLLTVGTYSVKVAVPGFKAAEVSGLEVHVGQPSTIPVILSTGAVTEEVSVTASELAPQLESAAAGTLIDAKQATELPLSSRNYLQLLTIQPGITGGVPGRNERGNIAASGAVNTQNFSVNGNPNNGNGFFLDGADTLKRAGQQPVTFPGVDFIQEINLQRASYGAEFGGPGSSVTSVQTKAGSTAFHGGAFYFFRSQILNANTYFNKLAGLNRGGEVYNDYGYYLGGPVWIPHFTNRQTTKTFFFFGQEYLRNRQAIAQNISNIPTAAQRTGVFATPVCTAYSANGNCAPTGSTTRIAAIDPTAQAYLKDVINLVPLPNNPNDPQGLIYNSPGTNNETQTLIRIDHQFNSKLSAFFRYLDDPFNLVVPNGFQQTSMIPGVATSQMTNGSTNWLGHFTYVIGTNHVLEGGYSTRSNWVTAHSIGLLTATRATDVNIQLPYTNNLDHVPQLNIGGSSYNVSGPYDERTPVQQIFVNNTNSFGRHTLKLGFNVELQRSGSTQGGANAGNFTFSPTRVPTQVAGQPVTSQFAQAFGQFLQGKVSNFTQANKDVASSSHLNIYEGYVQDDYKATPRLTILAGVRYTYFAAASNDPFPGHTLLPVLNFLPSAYNRANAPALDSNGLICTASPCAGGAIPNPSYNPLNGIIQGGSNSPYGNAVAHGQLDNVAPRVGFTLDVFGNGTTAVRGGYGLYFFSQIGNPSKFATSQNPPNVYTTTISNPAFANPGNGVPSFSSSPNPLQAYQAEGRSPYTEQYSFDVQQQLRRGLVLDMGYYGNHGVHLFSNIDLNQPVAGAYIGKTSIAAGGVTAANTPALNVLRPYPGWSSISYSSLQFFSKYNSLQTSLKARLSDGATMTLNYTWSKALTNSRTPQDNNNLASEYGPTGNDRRHVFNASFVYRLPFYRNQETLVGKIAGGFQVSGIVAYGSGQYQTATIGAVDPGGLGLLTGPAGARPDQVSNPNTNPPRSFTRWFNTASFIPTPAGQYRAGNARVANILGPGYGVWNLTVTKNIRLAENSNFQLRAEAFNVFNHTNFNGISTAVSATNYGQVTSTAEPRTMQLAAKYTF